MTASTSGFRGPGFGLLRRETLDAEAVVQALAGIPHLPMLTWYPYTVRQAKRTAVEAIIGYVLSVQPVPGHHRDVKHLATLARERLERASVSLRRLAEGSS